MGRNLLKILAVLVLAAALIGISVIKSNISAKRTADKMQSLKNEYFRTHDSLLLEQLDDTTRMYVDSIQTLQDYFKYQIDSLNDFYAEKESLLTTEIEKQRAEIVAAPNKATKPKPKKSTKPSISSKVIKDYNSLIDKLPGDLTDYEERVSVDEIVIELARKYKISPDKVKKYVK